MADRERTRRWVKRGPHEHTLRMGPLFVEVTWPSSWRRGPCRDDLRQQGRRLATVDTGGQDDVFKGALVTWLHVPRGGYGHTVAIPATVIAYAGRPRTWVRVEVARRDGSRVKRVVDAANLRWGHP